MGLIMKLKSEMNVLMGKITGFKIDIDIKHHWFGNDYGGFYVAPQKLNKNSVIYSFGVGEDISFDEALMKNFGCKVFAFDPTPKSIKWVENYNTPIEFTFFKYGIDDKTGIVQFLLPKNDNYVSGSVINQENVDENKIVEAPMKNLSDIVAELGHSYIDVLKVDIEGSEYKILDSIFVAPVEIGQILVEIHERFFPDGKEKTRKLLETFNKNGYKLFAVSDTKEELSFIKVH